MGTSIVHDTIRDTIHSVVYLSNQKSSDAIDILNKIDSFYESAWNKLIFIVSLIFIVIGIIVPLAIQYYQKKKLDIETANLERLIQERLSREIATSKTELTDEFNKKIGEFASIMDNKLEEIQASATAADFHLQANALKLRKSYKSSLESYIVAAENYLECDDMGNLLKVIGEHCIVKVLQYLSLEELEHVKEGYTSLDGLLDLLRKKNTNGVFNDSISYILDKKRALPKTIKDKKPVA